jgi:glucose-fructose oxidoreductase
MPDARRGDMISKSRRSSKKSITPHPRSSSRANAARARTNKVRYAVVGLGYISQVAVLPAFQHARRNSTLAGLVSDDALKLKQLGRKYGAPHAWSYEQFDECLHSGLIDAVYIALPNDMHRDSAIRAASAGVHVLCEKPLALTEKDCAEMVWIAREHDVRLMTAYRLHFERANLQAIEIVSSGKIGEPRIFDSLLTMQVEDQGNIRLKERNGGPLYDIGIYCINAARSVFRSEPIQVVALSANSGDPRFAEVDEMTSAILRFPGERMATFTCSIGACAVSSFRVLGTKGELRVEPSYELAGDLTHHLTVGKRKSQRTFKKRDQFAPELVYFSDCVAKGVNPEPSGEEGLADVRVIEALRQSAARGGKPVDLYELHRDKRPSARQEIHRPPVREPELVHARAPSKAT